MALSEKNREKIRTLYKAIIDAALEEDLVVNGALWVKLDETNHIVMHIKPQDQDL